MANSMLYICYHDKKNFPSKKNKKRMCRIASTVFARGNKHNPSCVQNCVELGLPAG